MNEQIDHYENALSFLNHAGDEEVRHFLRLLPVFASNDGDRITLSDLIFEMRLLPFVMDAWKIEAGSPGVPGRLQQFATVYKVAEAEMERLTGERRRLPRIIDVPSFVRVYSEVGLP